MVCRFCGEHPFHSPDCLLLEPPVNAPILFCSACGHLLVGAAYTRATEGRDIPDCGTCDSCARNWSSPLSATDRPEPSLCTINGEPVLLSRVCSDGLRVHRPLSERCSPPRSRIDWFDLYPAHRSQKVGDPNGKSSDQ